MRVVDTKLCHNNIDIGKNCQFILELKINTTDLINVSCSDLRKSEISDQFFFCYEPSLVMTTSASNPLLNYSSSAVSQERPLLNDFLCGKAVRASFGRSSYTLAQSHELSHGPLKIFLSLSVHQFCLLPIATFTC